ncbi:hypothetical protein D3C84_1248470 [compost metagenome]
MAGAEQRNGGFPCEALLGFAQPALGLLHVPEQHLGHRRHVRQTEQVITLTRSQVLTARQSGVKGVEWNDLVERFSVE